MGEGSLGDLTQSIMRALETHPERSKELRGILNRLDCLYDLVYNWWYWALTEKPS